MTEPNDQRTDQILPQRVVDAARPNGWSPIPTLTVPDALRLEKLLRRLWKSDASSWISPDGRHYVVPSQCGDATVDIYEGGPSQWGCNCDQAHETGASNDLCDAVIQVAILRGDLVGRKER